MQLIEKPEEFSKRFARWNGGEDLRDYPFVENQNVAVYTVKRALPLLQIADFGHRPRILPALIRSTQNPRR